MKCKLIYADNLKDLMYVACMGQDKEFVKVFEMVIDDCPEVEIEALPIVKQLKEELEYHKQSAKRWGRYCSILSKKNRKL